MLDEPHRVVSEQTDELDVQLLASDQDRYIDQLDASENPLAAAAQVETMPLLNATAALPTPSFWQPVGHRQSMRSRHATDLAVASDKAVTHQIAPFKNQETFWRCPHHGITASTPQATQLFSVKMQGCIIGYVNDADEAAWLSRYLMHQLHNPDTDWKTVQPKMTGQHLSIQLGQQTLLHLEPSVSQSFDQHPHQLATEWSNNIRLIAGKPALPLVKAQKQMYGLAKASSSVQGSASWYGPYFHGRMTANGEIYNQYDLTAAHRTLPLGSFVQVTNRQNGRSLVVRINDRGPYYDEENRIIDLSYRAAQILQGEEQGIMPIDLVVLENQSQRASAQPAGPQTLAVNLQ